MDVGEIAFANADSCFLVARKLLEEESYVVMISREENLWILNYKYSECADRNNVVFMDQDEYDKLLNDIYEQCEDKDVDLDADSTVYRNNEPMAYYCDDNKTVEIIKEQNDDD